MSRFVLFAVLLFIFNASFGQASKKIEISKQYANVEVDQHLDCILHLKKGVLYDFSVFQNGIDVKLVLLDTSNKEIAEKDSPNGAFGFEKLEYSPKFAGEYHLSIVRLEEDGNPEKGNVSISVKEINKAEIQRRNGIKKELEPENQKTVQTIDIDHFWEAFDNLKNCKTRADSIASFQTIYLDRATDGLLDFIEARQFTAEKFAVAVSKLPKFYNSVRKNTLEAKNSAPVIEEIVARFRELYPNFKPHRICFAIGLVNTGGTVSEEFLLIGTEVSAATQFTDLSEFNNNAYSKQLSGGSDVTQKIKNMVAHEYVHTQQHTPVDPHSISCPLLYACLLEGMCDFIGEMISGSQINLVAQEYGDAHERQIWHQFKAEMCNDNNEDWLYNYERVKNKPADLGYYVGYKIAAEYYNNATDKKQAITDIIELNDPIEFLRKSGYDQKVKK